MRKLALVAAVSLFSLAACGSSSLHVPKVVGMHKRAAETLLAKEGLRWRYGRKGSVESAAPRPNVITSQDSDPVVRQSPEPGTSVKRGAVVTLTTECMVHGPCA